MGKICDKHLARSTSAWSSLKRRFYSAGAGREHGGSYLDEEPFRGGRRKVQRVLQVHRKGLRRAACEGQWAWISDGMHDSDRLLSLFFAGPILRVSEGGDAHTPPFVTECICFSLVWAGMKAGSVMLSTRDKSSCSDAILVT